MIRWMIATLCAFFIKGLCGFANTLVFTSILSFTNDNVNISPVELLLGYPSNAIMAWRERKCISWKLCIPIALLVLLGSLPGIFLLKHLDAGIIKVFFGIVIILIGCEMLYCEMRPGAFQMPKVMQLVVGALSGVLCGLYGVGALLGACLSRITTDSHSFKANISIIFLIENTFRIVLYGVYGILTLQIVVQAIQLLPFMLIGLFCGMVCAGHLPERVIKRLVIVLLMISGVALIIQNI